MGTRKIFLAALVALVLLFTTAAAGQAAVVNPPDVTSTVTLADGTVRTTVYTPAKGVTPAQLAAKLTAAKVPGVKVGAGIRAQATLPCSYTTTEGTASAYFCPVKRWIHGPLADPAIYFHDFTSSAWPVLGAVTTWNQAKGIDSYYSATCTSGNGRHCVSVYSAAYGNDTGWTSFTTFTTDAGSILSAYVRLNDSYPLTAGEHRNVACRGLGIALGLGGNSSTTSCMYNHVDGTQLPNSTDMGMLARIYT